MDIYYKPLSMLVFVFHIFLFNGCADHQPQSGDQGITYEYIVSKYFSEDDRLVRDRFNVDLFSLYQELGLHPESNKPGKTFRMKCSMASLAKIKVIALARDLGRTQVLVFGKKEDSYIFIYSFTLPYYSDYTRIKLKEPEPGLDLLEITYRNCHGTSTFGWGWALYLLDDQEASLLLKTNGYDGYSMGGLSVDYGYSCSIKPLEESWPKIEMDFFSEYLRKERHRDITKGYVGKSLIELRANVMMEWDPQKRNLIPSPDNVLEDDEIHQIVEDQIKFITQHKDDNEYLAKSNCPIRIKKGEKTFSFPWGK